MFSNDLCSDGGAIRREAKRRKKLYEDGSADSSKYGNRLHIIGYNEDDTTVDGLHYVPGKMVDKFNGKTSDYLSMFIHAPFKSDLVRGKADEDENAASIVVQMRLRTQKNGLSILQTLHSLVTNLEANMIADIKHARLRKRNLPNCMFPKETYLEPMEISYSNIRITRFLCSLKVSFFWGFYNMSTNSG